MASLLYRRLAILAAVISVATAARAAEPLFPAGGTMPSPAIILFWASWCASCRAEMQRLPAIAAAAGTVPVATIALDPPDRARAALARVGIPAARAYADARTPAVVLAEWGGRGAALPLAAAIDRHGRVCGVKRGLLGTDEVRAWAARCSR